MRHRRRDAVRCSHDAVRCSHDAVRRRHDARTGRNTNGVRVVVATSMTGKLHPINREHDA